MSSITAADLKLGGRLVTACDAVGAGHLRKAAGIFAEIADDLNLEAESTSGLLVDEDEWAAPLIPAPTPVQQSAQAAASADLQACTRNAHVWGQPDPVSGWRTCSVCGSVNVAPPGDGPIDMGARQ